MPFMKSMRAGAGVADVYKAHSKIYLHWIRMGEEVMTKGSPLSQGERELIATYVSSLIRLGNARLAGHLGCIQGDVESRADSLVETFDPRVALKC